MKTLTSKSTVALAFLGFAILVAGCDRPMKYQQVDFAGKTEIPVIIPVDPNAPVEAKSLVINNQDVFTNRALTSLKLDASNVLEMYVTENADCSSGGTWEAFNTTKAYSLKKLNQNTSVFAKFRNGDYETACVLDDITHDDQGPLIQFTATPTSTTKDLFANYTFNVTDSLSGVDKITCALDSSPAANCTTLASYTNLLPGLHHFQVSATDKAGNTSSLVHNFEVTVNRHTQVITIGGNTGKADILFIVNNSFSMFSELRGPAAGRFSNFVKNLKDTDYNISVTSGDTMGSRPYEAGGFANILRTAVPGSGFAVLPKFQTITPLTKDGGKLLVTTLMRPESICIQTGTHLCPPNGSPSQQSIHSSLLALDRPENQSFFRSDSSLHIIIISDDDEGSGNLTDRKGNILPSTPAHNRPQTLINTVKARWPNKEFKIHSMINPKEKVCNAFDVQAVDAPIYQAAAMMTGGQVVNICNEFDMSETKAIADSIATSKPVYTLTCDPVDTNKDGRVDASDLSATYLPVVTPAPAMTLQGRTVTFHPSPSPGTEVRISYVCP